MPIGSPSRSRSIPGAARRCSSSTCWKQPVMESGGGGLVSTTMDYAPLLPDAAQWRGARRQPDHRPQDPANDGVQPSRRKRKDPGTLPPTQPAHSFGLGFGRRGRRVACCDLRSWSADGQGPPVAVVADRRSPRSIGSPRARSDGLLSGAQDALRASAPSWARRRPGLGRSSEGRGSGSCWPRR